MCARACVRDCGWCRACLVVRVGAWLYVPSPQHACRPPRRDGSCVCVCVCVFVRVLVRTCVCRVCAPTRTLKRRLPCRLRLRGVAGGGGEGGSQPPPGMYGDAGGATATCPANSYCDGSGAATNCPANTVSPAGSSAASDCRPAAGYYGSPGAAAARCRANTYCAAGASAETPCPANTQSDGAAAREREIALSRFLSCLTLSFALFSLSLFLSLSFSLSPSLMPCTVRSGRLHLQVQAGLLRAGRLRGDAVPGQHLLPAQLPEPLHVSLSLPGKRGVGE